MTLSISAFTKEDEMGSVVPSLRDCTSPSLANEPANRQASQDVPAFESDGEGYPADEWLDAFEAYELGSLHRAARFLVEDFPAACGQVACCWVTVEDTDEGLDKLVSFATGGWSGAEDLITAMLKKAPIRYFHTKWERGGYYEFRVPLRLLPTEDGSQAHQPSDGEAQRSGATEPNPPALPEREAAEAIAEEVRDAVRDHIRTMYPRVLEAAPTTFLKSVGNTAYNKVLSALPPSSGGER
jgi:hypothetical protein